MKVYNSCLTYELFTTLFYRSLGLAIPPKVRFLKKHLKQIEQKAEKAKTEKLKKKKSTLKTDTAIVGESHLDVSDDNSDSERDDAVPSTSKDRKNKNTRGADDSLNAGKKLQGKIVKPVVADSDDSSSDMEENSSDESDAEAIVTPINRDIVEGNSGVSGESGSESDSSLNESDSEDNDIVSELSKGHKTKVKVEVKPQKTGDVDSKRVVDKKNIKDKIHGRKTSDTESDNDSSGSSDSENAKEKGKDSESFRFDVDDDQELFSVKRNVSLKDIDKVVPVSVCFYFSSLNIRIK